MGWCAAALAGRSHQPLARQQFEQGFEQGTVQRHKHRQAHQQLDYVIDQGNLHPVGRHKRVGAAPERHAEKHQRIGRLANNARGGRRNPPLGPLAQAVKHPLWHDIPDNARFYFVHSYYIEAGNPAQVVGGGHYGKDFAAALAEGSKFAVQFHPEKSHTHGLQLLQNFVGWDGRW